MNGDHNRSSGRRGLRGGIRRHAEKIEVRKETSAENVDSLINYLKVVRAERIKTSVRRKLIQARSEEHARAR